MPPQVRGERLLRSTRHYSPVRTLPSSSKRGPQEASGFRQLPGIVLVILLLSPAIGTASDIRLEQLSAISADGDASVVLAISDASHSPPAPVLQHLNTQGEWQTVPSRTSFGYNAKPTWLRGTLEQPRGVSILVVSNPWLEELEVWFLANGQPVSHHRTGSRHDFSARALQWLTMRFRYRAALNRLLIKAGGNSPHYVPVQWLEPNDFLTWKSRQSLGFGLYFGIIMIMLLYNLGLYTGFRDRAYLLYAAYAGTVCLSMAVINGFGQQYLWPELGGFDRSISYVLVAAGIGLSYWLPWCFCRYGKTCHAHICCLPSQPWSCSPQPSGASLHQQPG
jgi:hypothetical protein